MDGPALVLSGDGLMLFPSYRPVLPANTVVCAEVVEIPRTGALFAVVVPPDADTTEWERTVVEWEQGPQMDVLPLLSGSGRVGSAVEVPWVVYRLRGLGWDLRTPAQVELTLGAPLATWQLEPGRGWRMLPEDLSRGERLRVVPGIDPHPLPTVVLSRACGRDEAVWALVEIVNDAIFGSPWRGLP